MAETRNSVRLIVKKYTFIPVQGKLYRQTEILEEVISDPNIPTIDLTSESDESSETSETTPYSDYNDYRCLNSPTYCECPEHRDYSSPRSWYALTPQHETETPETPETSETSESKKQE